MARRARRPRRARPADPPEFLVVDGAAGLEKALAALWPAVPAQRCTVHKHRNLLAHAPEALHEEVSADYTDMVYAATPKEIEARRRAFLRRNRGCWPAPSGRGRRHRARYSPRRTKCSLLPSGSRT